MIDVEPFKTVYESGQPLSLMQRMPVQRDRRRSNQVRLPSQTQLSNQWAHQAAMPSPIQVQLPDQGSNQTMFPMPPQTQMQMPNPWGNQVGMLGPAQMQFDNQWANQTAMPVGTEYPGQRASQMLNYQQLENRRVQTQMQMDLQRQGYMQQMQQVQAEVPPLIPSTPELQMPAPTRPAEASDIAGIAMQMLTPFPTQPPTLASQVKSLEKQRRQSHDEGMQE